MPRQQIQLINSADFTGGLNLRADAFQLAANESPELLNVDLDPRGGLVGRKAALTFGDALGGDAHSILSYETTAGATRVVVGVGTGVSVGTGGAWTNIATQSSSARLRGVTFKDVLYVQNGADQPIRYDGSAATRLGQTYNGDYTAPNGGDMPIGKVMAVWMGCVWTANLMEGATARPNRVRFSHPNFPEDWRDLDYFDVDTGSDGDVITALVPFGDRLLVFKKRSIHAVYGTDPDNFSVLPVSQEVGALSQEAVVTTDLGLYFFSWPEGVYVYRGREPQWLFEKIFPAITTGQIDATDQDDITLGWGNRRLWVGVPYNSSTVNRTLVLDPTLGKQGSWTMFDIPAGPFYEYRPPGADVLLLAGGVGKGRLLKLDQDAPADNYGSGAVHIESYYRTRWFDLAQPAVRKKWRRPEFTLRSGAEAEIRVEVFVDYDASDARRDFTLRTDADEETLVWDVGNWDEVGWARDGIGNQVERGVPLGTSRAVQLRFNGPPTDVPWGVDAITLKFVPKPVRS